MFREWIEFKKSQTPEPRELPTDEEIEKKAFEFVQDKFIEDRPGGTVGGGITEDTYAQDLIDFAKYLRPNHMQQGGEEENDES